METGLPEAESCCRQCGFDDKGDRGGNHGANLFRRAVTEKDEGLTPYYCYIVRCSDGTLYTGITNDLERRISVHNKGKGGAYTASRRPVCLVYSECVGTKGDALRRELEIKALTRARKLALINGENNRK